MTIANTLMPKIAEAVIGPVIATTDITEVLVFVAFFDPTYTVTRTLAVPIGKPTDRLNKWVASGAFRIATIDIAAGSPP